jgi:hypothetical protein
MKETFFSVWDPFVAGFCKVQFLCYQGDPNWLGWIVIGVGGPMVLYILLLIFLVIFIRILN